MKLTFNKVILLKYQESNLEIILAYIRITSVKTEFNGNDKNLACTYKLNDTKQVIITLTLDQVSSSNWTTVVDNSSITLLGIIQNINIITHIDNCR